MKSRHVLLAFSPLLAAALLAQTFPAVDFVSVSANATTGQLRAPTNFFSNATNATAMANAVANGTATAAGRGLLTVSATTGTGSAVLATSPTLVTPNIGAATGTSLTLSGNFTLNDIVFSRVASTEARISTQILSLSAAAATQRGLTVNTSTNARWFFGADTAAESGSNVGSDFVISRYYDGGTLIDTPFKITRSTGATTLTGSLAVGGTFMAIGTSSTTSLPTQTGAAAYLDVSATTKRFYFGDGSGYSLALSTRVGGSTTDRITVSDTGTLTTGGKIINANGSFITVGAVTPIIAPGTAGSIFLRPNGEASTTGQFQVASTGDVTVGASLRYDGQLLVGNGSSEIQVRNAVGTANVISITGVKDITAAGNLTVSGTGTHALAGNTLVGSTVTNAGSRLVSAVSDSATTFAGNQTQNALSLVNLNTTDNNWANILWSDDNSTPAAVLGVQFTDHTNNYAKFQFGVRGSGGFVSNALTIAPAGVSIKGTTTNDNAATGDVGEYVSSTVASGSAVALTTGTAANVTSISLTAGDWDVEGVFATDAGSASVTTLQGGPSSTSATLGALGSFSSLNRNTTATTETNVHPLPRVRFSLSSTTTVYLVGRAYFTAGTVGAYGTITARRVR